jgi:hypothetical protein
MRRRGHCQREVAELNSKVPVRIERKTKNKKFRKRRLAFDFLTASIKAIRKPDPRTAPILGFRPRPVFSSDFTHFDVPDFADVIPEAFEMVEKGFVTEHDFREYTFTNAAMLHTRNNPGFFKGTVVEQAVAAELGLERASPAATA